MNQMHQQQQQRSNNYNQMNQYQHNPHYQHQINNNNNNQQYHNNSPISHHSMTSHGSSYNGSISSSNTQPQKTKRKQRTVTNGYIDIDNITIEPGEEYENWINITKQKLIRNSIFLAV